MIASAIDIGTNSIRCLIAKVEEGRMSPLFREARITRLGESLAAEMELQEGAIERTLKVISEYRDSIEILGSANNLRVVATSAVRDASNQDEFLREVSECCGYDVEVITGEQEAELSFKGAVFNNEEAFVSNRPTLVIDIGGGSTEIIVGSHEEILFTQSLDVGCVRLFELFLHHDPPSLSEVKALRDYLWQKTQGLAETINAYYPGRAIGLAGTLSTLTQIKQQLKVHNPERIHGSFLSRADVNTIYDQLVKLPTNTRKRIIGLQPERADTIVAGTLILLELMKAFRLMEIMVSEHDILDGLILSMAEE